MKRNNQSRLDNLSARDIGIDNAAKTPWLYYFGMALCCLHMVMAIPDVYSYALDAIGLAMLLSSALFHSRIQMRFDLVTGLLVARVFWLLSINVAHGAQISMFLNNAFFAAVAAVFVYLASSNIDFTRSIEKAVYGGIAIIATVIIVQTVGCYIEVGTFSDFATNKYAVSIPYGDSNSVAMGFTAMCAFLFLMSKSAKIKIIWGIIAAVGMVLLSSSGCMLSIAITLLVLAAVKMVRILSSKADARILAGLFITLVLVLILSVTGAFTGVLVAFSGTAEKIAEFISGDLTSATTGRTTIYLHYLNLFFDSPVVGYGTIPAAGYYGVLESYRAHNLILEALYHGGLINFFLYVGACATAFRNMRKDAFSLSAAIAIAFLLVNSMFEPGVFGFNKDFFMWLLLGLSQRREELNAFSQRYWRGGTKLQFMRTNRALLAQVE